MGPELLDCFWTAETQRQVTETRFSPLLIPPRKRGSRASDGALVLGPRFRGGINSGTKSVLGGAEVVQEAVDGGVVELADGFGEAVGELGGLGGEAGGVDDDAGMRELGQALEVVDVVPGEVEVGGDLLHEPRGGTAAVAVLERREIGRGDAERGRHVLEAEAAGSAQLAQATAEGRHRSTFPRPLRAGDTGGGASRR